MRLHAKPVFAGAMVLAALTTGGAADAAKSELELKVELPAESFIRGCLDPVEGLVVTLTVTNNGITPWSLPVPRLDPVGGTEFEVYLLGAAYGEPKTAETPARTPIRRRVPLLPVGGNVMPLPGYLIDPGGSEQFQINVGRNYDFKAAGRYEMTCVYHGQRSNSATFEVLPLKRVDVIPHVLLTSLADYESGEPEFPFMFYITEGQDRFDQIVYLVRSDSGSYEHYEYHRLAQVAPGVTPDMVVAGSKVGILVPDKANDAKTRFFTVDFGAMPMKVTGEESLHEPGSGPSMSVDASGNIVAQ